MIAPVIVSVTLSEVLPASPTLIFLTFKIDVNFLWIFN